MVQNNGLTGELLKNVIKQYIDALDCIYKSDGIKTIAAHCHDDGFYEIQKYLRKCHQTSIEHDKLVSIIEELGIRVSFLPPLDQRSDDGIDNALDGDK